MVLVPARMYEDWFGVAFIRLYIFSYLSQIKLKAGNNLDELE